MNSKSLAFVVGLAVAAAFFFIDTEAAAILAAAAPASFVTAHSSQVVARNYNGFAAPLVAAPAVVAPAVAAPFSVSHVAEPYVAYNAFQPYFV